MCQQSSKIVAKEFFFCFELNVQQIFQAGCEKSLFRFECSVNLPTSLLQNKLQKYICFNFECLAIFQACWPKDLEYPVIFQARWQKILNIQQSSKLVGKIF
jgi:hypothetical protein